MYYFIDEDSPTFDGLIPSDEVMEDLQFEPTDYNDSWIIELELDHDLSLVVEISSVENKYHAGVYSAFSGWVEEFNFTGLWYAEETYDKVGKLMRELSEDLGFEVEYCG